MDLVKDDIDALVDSLWLQVPLAVERVTNQLDFCLKRRLALNWDGTLRLCSPLLSYRGLAIESCLEASFGSDFEPDYSLKLRYCHSAAHFPFADLPCAETSQTK
jgi:hypothetical protein